jgi:hypothetical protein
LDDEVPAFVKEPTKRVPICLRCGADVLSARSLYTICEACICRDLGIVKATGSGSVRQVISELARKFTEEMSHHSMVKGVTSSAVVEHANRLRRRGLSDSMARRQAEAMVNDDQHVTQCELCRSR